MTWNRILTFVIGVNAFAWLGAWLANGIDPENPLLQTGGILFMSMSPLIVAFILKKMDKEDWSNAGLKHAFSKNKGWYLFSFMAPMVMIFSFIGLSFFFDFVSVSESFSTDLPAILGMGVGMFFAFSLAAVGEEFGWRGYLEPSLARLNKNLLVNHVIVGVVWFAWHLPLLFLAGDSTTAITDLAMILVGTIALAIVYGQLKIITGSVWPCVVLHGAANGFVIAFGSFNVLAYDTSFKNLISLNSTSISVVAFWGILSLVMVALFLKKQKQVNAH